MYITVQAHEYERYEHLLGQYFRLRKRIFSEKLKWDVSVKGDFELDSYDELRPVYLIWCDENRQIVFGGLRLLPTTGPTLLHDVFHRTIPVNARLQAPGIWEGTRMCIDEALIKQEFPQLEAARAFCLLLLALCECCLEYGIHTMISNYEPYLKRVYRRAGALVEELGRAEGYGPHPVCCGCFEVSERVLLTMRETLNVKTPLYLRNPDAVLPDRQIAA